MFENTARIDSFSRFPTSKRKAKVSTERQMLSDISKTFDPLRRLSPVTIFLKQLMQRAWEAKISWEDHIYSELADHYLKWRSNLISLRDVELQLFVLLDGFSDKIELHLFCDASERAYAGRLCLYCCHRFSYQA